MTARLRRPITTATFTGDLLPSNISIWNTTTPSANQLVLYRLVGADAQHYAYERIGRDLTCEEMESVKKYVEQGMADLWTEIGDIAVEMTVEDLGLQSPA